MKNEEPKTAVAYHYGNNVWGLPDGKRFMGTSSHDNYPVGHYYVLYLPNFIIDLIPYD